MATIYKDLEDVFTLKSENNPILISVKTGNGQAGSYFIFNGTKRIGTNKTTKIDKGSDCLNQTITIVVVVKDKLNETNWTSATVNFTEDNLSTIIYGPYEQEVQNDFDTVIFIIKIKVKK